MISYQATVNAVIYQQAMKTPLFKVTYTPIVIGALYNY